MSDKKVFSQSCNGKTPGDSGRPIQNSLGIEIKNGQISLDMQPYTAMLLARTCDQAVSSMRVDGLHAEANDTLLRWLAVAFKSMAVASLAQQNMPGDAVEPMQNDIDELLAQVGQPATIQR